MRKILFFLFVLLVSTLVAFGQEKVIHPSRIAKPVYFDISPPLRDMVANAPAKVDRTWKDGIVKNFFNVRKKNPQDILPSSFTDPARQETYLVVPADTTLQNFDGTGMPNGDGWPPDTDGDVGPNHYFQVVNCKYAIYNKSGVKLLGPVASSTIWNGLPNNSNDGDAVVLYDEIADRWLFTQFSLPNYPAGPYLEMIAVSQTNDPTGSWYRWEYTFSEMPDYPKFGIWPDGYYMSANRFANGANYAGTLACAFDRTAMLAGNASPTMIQFTLGASNDAWSMLPSDCDGTFPTTGTPNYFTYMWDANPYHLAILEFHSDWTTPANSTFGNLVSLPVTSFNSNQSNIAQPSTTNHLDAISDRLMYRQQYRKFTDHQSMVLCHTVNTGSNVAGIRWYELRNTGTGWSVYQQSTYNPADTKCRWMGSIAMDADGDIALGYSVANSSTYPSIRYTGRLNGDALNTMTLGEHGIINGTGSQTIYNRWGDYSCMSTDPSSTNIFWYTQEYVITTGTNWKTRIASFQFGGIPFTVDATASPSTIDAGQTSQLNVTVSGGSGTFTYAWTSNPPGFNSTIPNPVASPIVTTKYYVTVNDGSQERTDSVTVTVNMYVTASADPTTINPGGSSQLTSSVTGGSGNFTYQWTSNPPGYTSNQPNPVVMPNVNTVYTCQVNDGSQVNSDTTGVNVNMQSTATANPSSICLGSSSQLNVVPTGGSGYYTYSWTSNPPGFTSSSPNPVVYPTVNTDYYSQVSDGTQTSYDTVSVSVWPAPSVYAGIDTTVCNSITQFRVSGTAAEQSSVAWSTSGDGIFGSPTALSSLYYPGTADHSAGTVTLTLTAYPILPCTNTVTDTRIVLFDPCTGIPYNEQGFVFSLYPNPATSQVTLTLKGTDNSTVTITVLDMQGRKVFEDAVIPDLGNILKTYDLSGYSKGFYIFRVIGNNLNRTQKLMIQ